MRDTILDNTTHMTIGMRLALRPGSRRAHAEPPCLRGGAAVPEKGSSANPPQDDKRITASAVIRYRDASISFRSSRITSITWSDVARTEHIEGTGYTNGVAVNFSVDAASNSVGGTVSARSGVQ